MNYIVKLFLAPLRVYREGGGTSPAGPAPSRAQSATGATLAAPKAISTIRKSASMANKSVSGRRHLA
jgi:hypothetical protein